MKPLNELTEKDYQEWLKNQEATGSLPSTVLYQLKMGLSIPPSDHASNLETMLTQANARIAELEAELQELRGEILDESLHDFGLIPYRIIKKAKQF